MYNQLLYTHGGSNDYFVVIIIQIEDRAEFINCKESYQNYFIVFCKVCKRDKKLCQQFSHMMFPTWVETLLLWISNFLSVYLK